MLTSVLAAGLLLAAPGQTPAKGLLPGDQAPILKVAEWVKGDAFPGYDKSSFTVIEFWATWCPYSRQAIPTMTTLARKYKGRIPFIAVSTWEQGNAAELVKSYVNEFGKDMDYTIARDTPNELMARAFLETTDSELPTAFVIDKTGKIVWIGHPMDLEPILEAAAMKKLDANQVRTDFLAAKDAKEKEKEFSSAISGIKQAFNQGGRAEAIKALQDLKAPLPYLEGEKANNLLGMLAEFDMEKAEAYATALEAAPKVQAMALAQWVFYLPHGSQGRDFIYAPLMKKTYAALAAKHGAGDPTLHLMAAYSFFQLNQKEDAKKAAETGLAELPKSDLKDNKDLKDAFEELIKKAG